MIAWPTLSAAAQTQAAACCAHHAAPTASPRAKTNVKELPEWGGSRDLCRKPPQQYVNDVRCPSRPESET